MLAMACADPLDFWLDVVPALGARLQASLERSVSKFRHFNVANATGRCGYEHSCVLALGRCVGAKPSKWPRPPHVTAGRLRMRPGLARVLPLSPGASHAASSVAFQGGGTACRYHLNCSDRVQRAVLQRLQELACLDMARRLAPSRQSTSGHAAGGPSAAAWRNVCVDGAPIPPDSMHPLGHLRVLDKGVVTLDYVSSWVRTCERADTIGICKRAALCRRVRNRRPFWS